MELKIASQNNGMITNQSFNQYTKSMSPTKEGGTLLVPGAEDFLYDANNIDEIQDLVKPFLKKSLIDMKYKKEMEFAGRAPAEGLEFSNMVFEFSEVEGQIYTDEQKESIRDALITTINDYANERLSTVRTKEGKELGKQIKAIVDEIERGDRTNVDKLAELEADVKLLSSRNESIERPIVAMIDNIHTDTDNHHIQFNIHKYPIDLEQKIAGGTKTSSVELTDSSQLSNFSKMLEEKISEILNEKVAIITPFTSASIKHSVDIKQQQTAEASAIATATGQPKRAYSPSLTAIKEGSAQISKTVSDLDKEIEKLTKKREVAHDTMTKLADAEVAIEQKIEAESSRDIALKEKEIAIEEKDLAVGEKDNALTELSSEQQKVEAFNNKNQELITEVENINEKLSGVIEEKDLLENEKDEIIESKEDEILEISEKLTKSEEKAISLTTENSGLTTVIDDLETENSGLTNDKGILETEKGTLKNNLDELKSELKLEKEGFKIEKEALETEKGTLKTDLDELKSELKLEKEGFKSEKEEFKSEKEEFKSEIEELKSEKQEVKSEKDSVKTELDALKEEMRLLKGEIEAERKEHKEEKISLFEKIGVLETKVTEKVAEKSSFVEPKSDLTEKEEADALKALDEYSDEKDIESDDKKNKGKDEYER